MIGSRREPEMARDAGMLVYEQSYLLEAVSLIGMFSHTDHVELITAIKKRE